jgi:hypothetical protein
VESEPNADMAGIDLPQRAEVKVQTVQQFFNSMDPSPFHERDIDHDAEQFIVDRKLGEIPVEIRISAG